MVIDLAFPSLADEQVLLRPWNAADVPQQMEAFRDPVILAYSDWQPHSSDEAHQRLRHQEQSRLRGEQIDFARRRGGSSTPNRAWANRHVSAVKARKGVMLGNGMAARWGRKEQRSAAVTQERYW